MSGKIKLLVRFVAEAEFSVDGPEIKAYADIEGYDWANEDERKEAIACWVYDNAMPESFTSMGGCVALNSDLRNVSYEVPEEAILEVKEIE
jgi:hypothetical protein